MIHYFKNWKEYWKYKGNIKEKDLRILSGYNTPGLSIISNNSHKMLVKSIVRKLKLDNNDILLDVGCGAGVLTLPLSNFVKKIIGIDYSPSMIRHIPKRIETHIAQASNIPFDNETFNKVLCHSVIQHFPNLNYCKKAAKEMYRVCKFGGLIYIVDIPDLAKEKAYMIARNKIPDKHNLKRLQYKKIFFKKMFPNVKIFDQKLKGYGNSKYRFNVLIKKV